MAGKMTNSFRKVTQIGGNSPNVSGVNKVAPLGGNTSNTKQPPKNTKMGGNYVPGAKLNP